MNRIIGKISTPTTIKCNISDKSPNINIKLNNGARGKSAYELWIEEGNLGSVEDFLNSLKASAANYESLKNKPSIESIEIVGNKTFKELGIRSITKSEIKRLL